MPFQFLADKVPAPLRGRLGLSLAALLGLGLAIGISLHLKRAETIAIYQEVERRAEVVHDLLRQDIQEYDSALHGLGLLAFNSNRLAPREFKRAAEETLKRVPGIQAVQWVSLVPGTELAEFTTRARKLVAADFTPRQRRTSGELEPIPPSSPDGPAPADRALVTYLHPWEGNEAALGYDVFTAPTASDLARAAASPGEIVLSRAFPLVQGGEGIVLAIFLDRPLRDASPPPLGGPGFLQLVLRLDTLLGRDWNHAAHPILDVMLVDATTSPPTHLQSFVDGRPRPQALDPATAGFPEAATLTRDLQVGGRFWRAHYRPRAAWIASRRSQAPLLALLGTGLLTLVSVAYLNTLFRRTERIRREVEQRTAELAESRALLDEIIDHNPGIIWVKDASLRYQLVNLRFAAAHGRAREDILGRGDEGLHPSEVVRTMEALDARILATGDTVSFEENYAMPDRQRTYLVSKFPLRRAGGAIYAVAGIATDITDLREAERGQRTMERKLLEAQKLESLGILAGGVAHDFNNLLTGVLGHANLARAQLSPADPVQSSLAQIETSAHRAAELCRQMLAYSGRGRLSVQAVDLGEIARETVRLLKPNLSARARLRFEFSPSLPRVVADPVQIRQIAMNLVINASEALPKGEGEITLRTRLVAADAALFAACVLAPELQPGDYACLEVTDTGCGMDAETVARVFDPFFSTKFTGRGLGLAAVLGIVRGHEGALQVESTPGAGTTFRLFLPAGPAGAPAPAPRPTADAPLEIAPGGPQGLRILLVDDEDAVRDTAGPLLTACGHHVEIHPDGESGLRAFLTRPAAFDLALLDLTMPGLGGADLLLRFREVRPEFPVLLISGYTDHDAPTARLLEGPRVAFLAKPFSLAELRAKIASLA